MEYFNQIKTKINSGLKVVKDQLTKSELELKLEEATSNEHCHANVTLLNELSRRSERRMDFPVIYQHCSEMLNCRPEKWRRILKTLFLIEHILRTGGSAFLEAIKDDKYKLRNLSNFTFIDTDGKDKGETSK